MLRHQCDDIVINTQMSYSSKCHSNTQKFFWESTKESFTTEEGESTRESFTTEGGESTRESFTTEEGGVSGQVSCEFFHVYDNTAVCQNDDDTLYVFMYHL